MNKKLYRLLIKAVPKPKLRFGEWTGFSVPEEKAERLIRILERERAQGGVLALMAADGAISAAAFGVSRFRDRQPARPDDCFRCASISKHVTAAGVLRLAAQGKHEELYRDCPAYRRMVELQKLEEEGGEQNA